MEESIKKLMIREHKKIEPLLAKLKEAEDKNSKDFQYLLDKLNWMLKQHFFMEEKLIFSVHSLEPDFNDSKELVSEHESVLGIIKKIQEGKSANVNDELENLELILEEHSRLEEEVFYEKLDERLTSDEKKEIRIRAAEILTA